MFGIKGYLIGAVVLATAIGGFYWYYTDSQARIATLLETSAKLELAIQTNEQTIDSLTKDYEAINRELTRVNTELSVSRDQNNDLVDKLSRHDLGYLALKRPGLVEKIINNASGEAARCFELLSGAPLTAAEQSATSAQDFNSECPFLWTE